MEIVSTLLLIIKSIFKMKTKIVLLLLALVFSGMAFGQQNCTEERSNVSTMTAPILMAPGWARVMTCYNYERTCLTENGTSYTVDYGRECEEHITFLGVQIVDADKPETNRDFQGRLIVGAGPNVMEVSCSSDFEGTPGPAYFSNGEYFFDTAETTIGFNWGLEVCTTLRTYKAFFITESDQEPCVILQSESTECNRVPIIF